MKEVVVVVVVVVAIVVVVVAVAVVAVAVVVVVVVIIIIIVTSFFFCILATFSFFHCFSFFLHSWVTVNFLFRTGVENVTTVDLIITTCVHL